MTIYLKRVLYAGLMLWMLIACDSDSIGGFEDLVLSENAPRELIFTLTLRDGNGDYLVVHEIDSIELEIDGKMWGYYRSEVLDTANLPSKSSSGNFFVTADKLTYLAVNQYVAEDTVSITTAGQVVEALQDRVLLNPGDHIGRIRRLLFRNNQDQVVYVNAFEFMDFYVRQEDENVYVGEFVIETDL